MIRRGPCDLGLCDLRARVDVAGSNALNITTLNRIADGYPRNARLFWNKRLHYEFCTSLANKTLELSYESVKGRRSGAGRPGRPSVRRRRHRPAETFLGVWDGPAPGAIVDPGRRRTHLTLLAQTMQGHGRLLPAKGKTSASCRSATATSIQQGGKPRCTGTLTKAIDKINMVPGGMKAPGFHDHTEILRRISKAAEFDTGVQGDQSAKVTRSSTFSRRTRLYDDGSHTRIASARGTQGNGLVQLYHKGVHSWV